MTWLLIFFTTSYSGALDYIEFNTKTECEQVRETLIQMPSVDSKWVKKVVVCIPRSKLNATD